jgi:hypothetical protein
VAVTSASSALSAAAGSAPQNFARKSFHFKGCNERTCLPC